MASAMALISLTAPSSPFKLSGLIACAAFFLAVALTVTIGKKKLHFVAALPLLQRQASPHATGEGTGFFEARAITSPDKAQGQEQRAPVEARWAGVRTSAASRGSAVRNPTQISGIATPMKTGQRCRARQRCCRSRDPPLVLQRPSGPRMNCPLMKAALLCAAAFLASCSSTGSGLEDFPCDAEGLCPGRLKCNASVCLAAANCSAGQSECARSCVSTQGDPKNCGSCGTHCPPNQECRSGGCVPTEGPPSLCGFCAQGVACVDGKCSCEGRGDLCTVLCIDNQQSAVSCGACFNYCKSTNAACRAGTCVCAPGEKDCAGNCKPVLADPSHCGDCARACATGQKCENGACVAACVMDTTNACHDAKCWNLTTDREHCGAACKRCDQTQQCVSGTCSCPVGTVACGAKCIDLSRDLANCGACGKRCAVGEDCKASVCDCQNGLTRCGGNCTALADDFANCGACDAACAPGQVCSKGKCEASCSLGTTACDGGFCLAGLNPNHCGGCNSGCEAGSQCSDGQCIESMPAVGCTGCPCDLCDFDKGWLCCLNDGKPFCSSGYRCPK